MTHILARAVVATLSSTPSSFTSVSIGGNIITNAKSAGGNSATDITSLASQSIATAPKTGENGLPLTLAMLASTSVICAATAIEKKKKDE